jgi:hypothetical protein
MSALKVGFADVAPVSVAELVAGLDCNTHLYESESLLASVLA